MTTLSSANTSKTGKPAELFTDINESLRSSITENNVPLEPSARITVAPAVVETACSCPDGEVVPIPTLPL